MKGFGGASKEILFLLTAIIFSFAGSYFLIKNLPKDISPKNKKLNELTIQWEKSFKEGVIKILKSDASILHSTIIDNSLDSILHRMSSTIEDIPYDLDLFVVKSQNVNALTFPGGLIVLFTPLIRITETPEELAAVIAHEMAHVINRDPVDQMAKKFGISILGSIIGGKEGTAYLEKIVGDMISQKYSRDKEERADSLALEILISSKIDPKSFINFMSKLKIKKSSDDNPLKYFMSHPEVEERISKAESLIINREYNALPININWVAVKQSLPSIFDSEK